MVTIKNEVGLIGTVCLWNFYNDNSAAEIGYELETASKGKGYMNEAVATVIDFAFQSLGLIKVDAYTHKENKSSEKLLLMNRFELNTDKIDAENPDNLIFSLSSDKYFGSGTLQICR
jgi:ribosomal-protein-alanine N-acetyltransferase